MSEAEYVDELNQFNSNLTEFCKVGTNTFLSSHGQPDDDEIFYMYTLRYYIPRIAPETYQIHQTGVGIFNVQGFKRRNKESKNCKRRFSNNIGNVVINNMKRVCDVFDHKVNTV